MYWSWGRWKETLEFYSLHDKNSSIPDITMEFMAIHIHPHCIWNRICTKKEEEGRKRTSVTVTMILVISVWDGWWREVISGFDKWHFEIILMLLLYLSRLPIIFLTHLSRHGIYYKSKAQNSCVLLHHLHILISYGSNWFCDLQE